MLAVVGVTTWTTYLSYRPQHVAAPNIKKLPDAYMEEIVALVLDKQGKPSMKVVTPKMVHYAENDTARLTSPQITLYRKSPTPWYISADYATTANGAEYVNLWDNVVIHHAADDNNPATLIKTQTLALQPNKQIAETNNVITLIQPNLVVKATGMYADMNTGNIKLLSQARGEYVPNS